MARLLFPRQHLIKYIAAPFGGKLRVIGLTTASNQYTKHARAKLSISGVRSTLTATQAEAQSIWPPVHDSHGSRKASHLI